MEKTWILVANAAEARLLEAINQKSLKELKSLNHEASRLKESELLSDTAGRAFDSAGQGRHAMGTKVDAKEHEHIKFAEKLSHTIEDARTKHGVKKLYVVAGPDFLGLLRKKISADSQKIIAAELDKDLTHEKPQKIREALPFML